MSLSSPFIHRPVATTLLTAAIALAGAIAFLMLPVSPLPQSNEPVADGPQDRLPATAWFAGVPPRHSSSSSPPAPTAMPAIVAECPGRDPSPPRPPRRTKAVRAAVSAAASPQPSALTTPRQP